MEIVELVTPILPAMRLLERELNKKLIFREQLSAHHKSEEERDNVSS